MNAMPPALLALLAAAFASTAHAAGYERLKLTGDFYSEGATAVDLDKDGRLDVVSGPFWFAGPAFTNRAQIREPKKFEPTGYSDNFLTYAADCDGDGWSDVICIPWPGKEGWWQRNPAGHGAEWTRHATHPVIDNESPTLARLVEGPWPQIVFNHNGCGGYAAPDPAQPDAPWTFVPVTPDQKFHKYTHGLGVGDVNGDGRMDLLESNGWWEQPKDWKPGTLFTQHAFKFAEAGCQMFAYDVDGDGHNDVITTWHCHHYGLLWYRQTRGADGAISFARNVILAPEPTMAADEFRISQMHGLDLADVDGDGLKDIVTGKRFWAHGPKGDKEPDAPAVVYAFLLRRDGQGGARFEPLQIDNDSGVGTQVTATDLNGDRRADIAVGNKKGIFIHLSK